MPSFDISIHAPREGSDGDKVPKTFATFQFLSTLPVRGATCPSSRILRYTVYFYPRSP